MWWDFCQRHKNHRCVPAWTLVELLVVIAIVASLTGLILAGVSAVRERASQTVCLSNLSQLGKAFLMYAQDWDDLLPPYRNWPIQAWGDGVTPPEIPWLKGCGRAGDRGTIFAPHLLFLSVNTYARSADLWFCPADPYAGTETFYWCIFHRFTSYYFSVKRPGRLTVMGLWTRSKHFPPSEVRLAVDPNFHLKGEACKGIWEPDYYRACKEVWDIPGGQHRNGVNELYLDGHVHWSRLHPPEREGALID
ncbi:MAG: type II secretion system GspH family protein [Armatimonadetes bacterium]|nr:type II secretion system GspH family protein [Armatimonadota bacterium]MDW8122278.1 type II secretion system protein [Armatimonadota bacterium]